MNPDLLEALTQFLIVLNSNQVAAAVLIVLVMITKWPPPKD